MNWQLTLPPPGTCDWGDCDAVADGWRFSDSHGWLPVCYAHSFALVMS